MTWKHIIVSKEEEAAFVRAFSKKARFLLDEDIDPSLAPMMRDLGWNVCLQGHPDESVLAYAKREDRVLLTHDDGYLDDRRHPPHRNPGVVVIPQEEAAAVEALSSVLPIVGQFRGLFRGDKIRVDAGGTIKIKSTDHMGMRKTMRYDSRVASMRCNGRKARKVGELGEPPNHTIERPASRPLIVGVRQTRGRGPWTRAFVN